MATTIDEIASNIYRISTFVPTSDPPALRSTSFSSTTSSLSSSTRGTDRCSPRSARRSRE